LIYAIGTKCFPDDPERLFAHQIGDGFYIASDFQEPNLDRCVAIAVTIMRGMIEAGCVARGSIAEGALGDYPECRPREIRAAAVRDGDSDVVSLGMGLMTLQAVMGQGIINAVTLDKLARAKGSLLIIEATKASRLSPGFMLRPIEEDGHLLALDWVHSRSPLIDQISYQASIPSRAPEELAERIQNYITEQGLGPNWSEATMRFGGLLSR
jgi:hypothetical protein